MAATFTPARGLDEQIARLVAPAVGRVAGKGASEASTRAPQVKTWHTQGDALVRPWHKSANKQAIPGNLRFKVEHSPLRHNPNPPGHELLRFPRDPDAARLQRQDCRCYLLWNNALGESIKAARPVTVGTITTATVHTSFPRAAESEFGTDQDPPARFLGQAATFVKARL